MERSNTYDISIENADEFDKFNLSTVIDVIRGQLVQLGLKYGANDTQLDLLANILPTVESKGVFEVDVDNSTKLRMQWKEVDDDYNIHDQIKANLQHVVAAKKGFGILVGNLRTNYEQIYKQCATFIGPIIGKDYDKYQTLLYNSNTGCFTVSLDFGIKMGVVIETVKTAIVCDLD